MDTPAVMTVPETLLVLRGWRDSKARLRVVLRSLSFNFSSFCTVLDARDGRVGFWIGDEADKNAVDFLVADCFCGFKDASTEEASLPVGVEVETMIGAVRDDFALLIMLLK